MSDIWHNCDKAPKPYLVVLTANEFKFIDEYEHPINYCPYCGKSKGELRND